jgi:hypothetical protein
MKPPYFEKNKKKNHPIRLGGFGFSCCLVSYALTPSLFHPTVIWLSIRTRTKIMLIRTREVMKFICNIPKMPEMFLYRSSIKLITCLYNPIKNMSRT